ncbi:TetR/AcrR family transcriptional regulator [Mangrovibrevibacter kandeliae]|uniref:TetR/AcrR family transcriptional regulator n=1 Tax=Mangrovibrevibacter kandeliae TaxID=2968473 RepID=UPI002118A9BA|nr:TetR/AcrR family transcriptional regulator [Aurantimonas sp. CSK15Z-1]MCQ8781953.1 TetR/AcrR family transcriptional regulator [Aurantimonas sp. CSK15Z-1]
MRRMDTRSTILAGAARVFETEGFRGVGVDRLLAPSGASTRTLYKHFGSRDGLVLAVLEERQRSFLAWLERETYAADPVGGLFRTLVDWQRERGTHGCMLLRAHAEYAADSEAVVDLVRREKRVFRTIVAKRVAVALGREDARLATEIWLLFEGATAAAAVADTSVVEAAEALARRLVAAAEGTGS